MNRKEQYLNYLQTAHWQALRKAAFVLYGQKCEFCGQRTAIDIHHIQYHNLYDVKPKELAVLCRRHHDQVHNFFKKQTSTKIVNREQLFAWFWKGSPKQTQHKNSQPQLIKKPTSETVNLNRIINYLNKLQHYSPSQERAHTLGKMITFRDTNGGRKLYDKCEIPSSWLHGCFPHLSKSQQNKSQKAKIKRLKSKRRRGHKRKGKHLRRSTLKRKSHLR